MFRKTITSLAAIAALCSVAMISSPSFAMGGHGGHGMHGHGGHGGHGHWGHRRPNWHVNYRYHHRYRPVVYAALPAVQTVRGPCTCLTKEYTPDGTVIFKDLCTNEAASAPIPGRQTSEAPQSALPAQDQVAQAPADPNNFGGRTYQDFMASQGTPK